MNFEEYMSGKSDGKKMKDKILGTSSSELSDLRITFITPQVLSSETQIRRVQPPLGIACLAAVLEENGFLNIQFIDASAEGYNNIENLGDGFIKFGLNNSDVIKKIHEFKPDVIGVSALFSSQIGCAFEISKEIKKSYKGATIVFGGIAWVTPMPTATCAPSSGV